MRLHLLLSLAIIFNQKLLVVLLRFEIKKVVINRLVLLIIFIFDLLLSTFGRVHLYLALVLHELLLLLLVLVA